MAIDSMINNLKYNRILSIYTRLYNGEVINKAEEMQRFCVDERTIRRDIDALRDYFEDVAAEGGRERQLVYDDKLGGYCLKFNENSMLTNSETLAVCKILLESRAFTKEELFPIIHKLMVNCVPKSSFKAVEALISNEKFHYVEPHHRKKFIENLWEIGCAVKERNAISVSYQKQNGEIVKRKLKPVGIMFSEYYFYLTAFIYDIDKEKEFTNKDDVSPTIYRIDRIEDFTVLDEHFDVPYKDRFEEGEFRKRVQFMYGGTLRRIKFKYTGASVESVLDRLPTAKIVGKTDDSVVITAEVFGDGVDMWLRSQGENIVIIKE